MASTQGRIILILCTYVSGDQRKLNCYRIVTAVKTHLHLATAEGTEISVVLRRRAVRVFGGEIVEGSITRFDLLSVALENLYRLVLKKNIF